jgi:hypothetical protein
MLKIGFGNRAKPKDFGFIPRYYDPVKDELEERAKKFREPTDQQEGIENTKDRIRSGLRMKHYGDPNFRSAQVRQSNIRLLYIILVLLLAGYVLLSSNKVTGLIEALGN